MMNIIVVLYKNPEVEQRCLASVRKFTDLSKHTLTVFDNAPENINLGKLWNDLIEASDQEVICLLNSDTVVEEGWDRLVESLSDPLIGAVGPVTNKCGGKQKELTKNGKIEEINDLSGFCYLFTKKNWRKVGKMPEDMPFYGQESVFNRKLEDHGLKLMVDRRVFVWHEKGSSWLKAKERGDMKMEQADYGAFHYWNYTRRLKELRTVLPQGKRVVFLGAGKGNPFPTFIGIDQTISDFFGENAIHLPMESTVDEIMKFKPDYMIVVNTRYNNQWYDVIRGVRKLGVKTALYWMDLRRPLDTLFSNNIRYHLRDHFDHIFFCVNDPEWLGEWETVHGVKTTYLPQATIQHPVPPRGESFGNVHIGDLAFSTFHKERAEHMEQIRKEIPVVNLNELARPERIELSKKSYGIYGASDWCVSFAQAVNGYSSDRMYHILGAGGRLVCIDHGGHDHLKEYGYFEPTVEAMIERMKTVPDDGIKEKAFKYVQSHELYKDRYISLFKTLCSS